MVAPEDMSAQQPVAAVAGAAQTVTGGKQLNRRPFGRKDMTAGTAAVQSSAVSTVTGTLQTAPAAVSSAAAGQAATPATSAATPSAAVEAAPAAVKTQPARRSFRQRATIKKDNQASLFELKQSVNLAAGSYSETLMFGAEDSGESIPDGVIHNGEYEETIIPDTIVDYCNIGVDQLQDTSVMQNCLKQLITHQSDSDNQVCLLYTSPSPRDS